MGDEIAIKVDNVSKDFILPHENSGSVKGIFTSMFRKVSTKKETQHALRDISLEIKKGEFFGIVGRNGSGKSTLLKILANIYQPTTGQVSTYGKLVPFIELGVGFNPELSGRDNVYLNGAILGFSNKEIDQMYEGIVEFAELEKFMDQKLKNYSSGMQVRLAFSMATRSNADILLVDEVLAVGDADFQRKCFEYFRKLKRDKKTVVFVSHDMDAIREYCDRAMLIENSKMITSGTADQVAKDYVRLFVDPKEHDADNSEKWGQGGADITEVVTSKKIYNNSDDFIEITINVKALTDIAEGFIVGFTIKSDTGQFICGSNNKIIREENLKLKNGQSQKFKWIIPNIFNEGRFIVEPAVSRGDNMALCQWWNDARKFRVLNEYRTPYQVAPPIKLVIE